MVEKDSPQPDPERIGGHQIVGCLGEGPRGVVHLGRKSEDAPQVVIKTLTVDPAADPDFVARLKSVTRVSSSYVARTLDAGAENGLSYVVREHVEGRSLAEAVAADGPLTGDALERVAVGMLTALTAVHLAGFAHRGLTPSNVILTAEGPCVTDIELGDPVGELGYRAPEQLNGLQYGPYADVFAWAATVVFAATGAAPFGHDAEQLLNGEPEVGELPEPLRQVVLAALTKDVAGRPTTYTALLRLLGDVNAPMPAPPIAGVPSPPPAAGQQPGPVPPPAIQPIQLSIGAVQTPQMPPPQTPMAAQGPMDQHSMQAEGHVAHGATVPGPVEQGPIEQGPIEHGQMGQGPTPPVWGPPPGTAPQNPPQGWNPHVVPRQDDRQERKPFPIGLVAGVTAVALLSGLGLWGASQYSDNVTFSPAAAATGGTRQGDTAAAQGQDNVTLPPAQPQAEVTAPWATTPGPDESGVGPMVLPTDGPTETSEVPVVTSVPTPAPISTQPAPVPTVTVQPTQTQPAQKSTKPTKKAKPTATVTRTVRPSRSPSQKPTPTKTTEEPEPSPTKTTRKPTPTRTTQKPTPTKTTQKPTPTKTTQKPTPTKTTQKPTPTKTTPPPVKKNPYTATQVCGGGFVVQRSSSFNGGTTYQLWNNSTSQNCVVTLKSGVNVGKSTPVSATLEVQNGGSQTDSGNFEYYAGPVKLSAKGKCVRYSGSAGSGRTSTGWANCG